MNNRRQISPGNSGDESGAALVTVIMISFLLMIACISLLSAVGANSRNATDSLSETKAYYAAESGIQAAVNVLRNNCAATYSAAKADPDLSSWLTYNITAPDGTPAVVIGQTAGSYVPTTGAGYKIAVSDPDNIGGSTTFSTSGKFQSTVIVGNTIVTVPGVSGDGKSVTYGTSPNRTTIFIDDHASTTANFPLSANPSLTTFRIVNENAAAPSRITDVLRFEIYYVMTAPRAATKTIIGTVSQAVAGLNITLTFNAREYSLMGSYLNICDNASPCTVAIDPCVARAAAPYTVSMASGGSTTSTSVYVSLTPVEPRRIAVSSTGYGPNRSLKKLQAVIQRDFFDGLGSSPAVSMIGPNGPGFRFDPGNSNGIMYSGVSGPSFGLTDPTNLAYVASHPPGPAGGSQSQMSPPPALITDSPSWQSSPAALDAVVQSMKTAAQGAGTYYSGGGTIPFPPGDINTGTGITFCEGNCQAGGSGGGILVVTGTLTNVGNFSFKGLILVTGAGGWARNGGGNGTVTGNIVIAPYNPANLAAGFLPPQYYITGGGNSDVVFSELGAAFDGTAAATDLVQGVAEK